MLRYLILILFFITCTSADEYVSIEGSGSIGRNDIQWFVSIKSKNLEQYFNELSQVRKNHLSQSSNSDSLVFQIPSFDSITFDSSIVEYVENVRITKSEKVQFRPSEKPFKGFIELNSDSVFWKYYQLTN